MEAKTKSGTFLAQVVVGPRSYFHNHEYILCISSSFRPIENGISVGKKMSQRALSEARVN